MQALRLYLVLWQHRHDDRAYATSEVKMRSEVEDEGTQSTNSFSRRANKNSIVHSFALVADVDGVFWYRTTTGMSTCP